MRRQHLILILPLLLLVAAPLVATAVEDHEDRVLRSRGDDGRDRIIIRGNGRTQTLDMDELEDALAQLEHLDIDIEELVEEALEGLEDLDLDFGPLFAGNWDHEHYHGDFDIDEDAIEEWAEEFEHRMERWSEDLTRHLEHAFEHEGRRGMLVGDDGWRFRFDDDERDELEDEIRDLKRQIRRLQAELEDLRGEDEGDN